MSGREKQISKLHICGCSLSLLIEDASLGAKVRKSNKEGNKNMQDGCSRFRESGFPVFVSVLNVSNIALDFVSQLGFLYILD